MEPHLQQEDAQEDTHSQHESQEVIHSGAGGTDNLQQEDMYCFAFDEMLFTLNTRIIATFRGYPMS